jgi:GAF domain-containing protein
MASLYEVVLSQDDRPAMMREVSRIACRVVPNCDGASVTTLSYGQPTAVATDDWSVQLDEMQYVEHEGPCLDAYRSGVAFRVRDVTSESRWPSYLPKAASLGVRSMMSIPMTAESALVGALNIYSRTTDAFDNESASLAEIVAAHAGLASEIGSALQGHRDLAEQLAEAMRSRATIEQAKGIIMSQRSLTPDEAWDALVRMSQRAHLKLRDVATEIVDAAAKGSVNLDALDS